MNPDVDRLVLVRASDRRVCSQFQSDAIGFVQEFLPHLPVSLTGLVCCLVCELRSIVGVLADYTVDRPR